MKQGGLKIHVTGVVQGVGFRPFVYALARRLQLKGWVRNTSAGVDIELDGSEEALTSFARLLVDDAPRLARIDDLSITPVEPGGFDGFSIIHSEAIEGAFQPISPDVSICADCLRELNDPRDRRFRYPFINCTNCGPRFTIIKDIPYDRPLTTMAPFAMCEQCRKEYEDPLDRRFHAQPVACPQCGPQVWLETPRVHDAHKLVQEEAVQAARRLLKEGAIIAVKGLGGFHLACDALNDAAVEKLRERKLRVDKPFAVMMLDVETIEQHCCLTEVERNLLMSVERPIVILERREDSTISDGVAPGQDTIGVMLPYTPLHHLLIEQKTGGPVALVMTSGNLSEEPIATQNNEAVDRLDGLADAFLMHDRDIHTRCDDSVVRAYVRAGSGQPASISDANYPLRRSRGYAPYPVRLDRKVPRILGTGGELKNAFCLTNERYAFLSHHIGDMENYETLKAFEDGIRHLERLFKIQPQAIAYDLHPNYLATRYALERAQEEDLPAFGVQHHFAHILSCMAEHNLPDSEPVLGISFDGTGYGSDGAIWGGEVLLAGYDGYERLYHLKYTPLPGGDLAIKQPWRMALSWLWQSGIQWDADLPPIDFVTTAGDPSMNLPALVHQLESGLNAPQTSSMGRLFDAVSALAGVRQSVNYEAQAAIEFEAAADPHEPGVYPFDLDGHEIDPSAMLENVVNDYRKGVSVAVISARFHNGLAAFLADLCERAKEQHELDVVALSGGVWQNMTLLKNSVPVLESRGFKVCTHRQVPANDGGIALGQAIAAAYQMQ